MIKELYLGKIIYFLNEKIKELSENVQNNEKIKTLILDVYSALNIPEVYESVQKKLNDSTPDQIRKKIKSGQFKVYFTAIPFKHINFEDIQNAANILESPLDEKIYLPSTGTWTKSPVPVGVTYSQVLEQTAEIYSNVRSVGKYQGLTQQASKGKSSEGGQTIGQLDVNALLTYNVPAFLSELLTVRSDDHKSKRRVVNQIIANGSANIPRVVGGGGTVNLMNIFMTGMGLKIT